MIKSLLARLQTMLPTLLLTRLAGWLAESRRGWLKNSMIRWFSAAYNINWEEIEAEDATDFVSFNEFFCRPLRPGARAFTPAPQQLLSPCDGSIGACGVLDRSGQLLQAKGIDYPLPHLLACAAANCNTLLGHHYYTLYLAPHNYHRVHMPLVGSLQSCSHVPGRLFSVAPASAAVLPGLFCSNERLVCWFSDQQQRPWVMVLVGAMMVGSIASVWHGRYDHRSSASALHHEPRTPVQLAQGAEMGRFLLGSTVVLIAPQSPAPALAAGNSIWLHQPLSA